MTDQRATRVDDETDEIIWKKPTSLGKATADAIVLALLLAGTNWLIDKADPGWQRLNPTPWLLLPLFLGGRYGIGGGLTGALLAIGGVLGLQFFSGDRTAVELLRAKPFFFLALLLGGAVGSIIWRLVAGPAEALRQRALQLSERNRRLEEDKAVYQANEAQLTEALLLHGAESISLTTELHRLFSGEHGRFEDGLLRLLEREFGVIAAAIYRDDSGRHSSIPRVATTAAGADSFPSQLPSSEASLANAAISEGRLATWQSFDQDGASHSPHLAAIPWRWGALPGSGPSALLLIGRMDFTRINWETLSRIEAVFAWCMAREEPSNLSDTPDAERPSRVLPPEAFQSRIEEAQSLDDRLGLSSRLILFSADASAPQPTLAEFADRLKKIVSQMDPIGVVGDGTSSPYSIGVLTAAPSSEAAERRARQWLDRIGESSRAVRLEILSPNHRGTSPNAASVSESEAAKPHGPSPNPSEN